jgi:hypothetical protein
MMAVRRREAGTDETLQVHDFAPPATRSPPDEANHGAATSAWMVSRKSSVASDTP